MTSLFDPPEASRSKLQAAIPEAHSRDDYGRAAAAAMRTILEIGWRAWLQREVDNPSCPDPQWCRMIVRRVAELGGDLTPGLPLRTTRNRADGSE
jgi:hypothetical protein